MEEFTQLFAFGDGQRHPPQLPTKRTTSLEMSAQRLTRRKRTLPIAMHLMSLFPQTEQLDIVMGHLVEIQLSQGAYLFHQGDRPDSLYIVELGQISIVDDHSSQHFPIQTFESGNWLGGQEFYSQAVHRYSAIATQPSTLYCLSTSALVQLQAESPLIAHTITQHLLTLLAGQLSQAREAITTLIQGRTEMLDRLTAPSSE